MAARNNPGMVNQVRVNSVLPRNTTGSASSTSVTIKMSRDIGARRYEFTLYVLNDQQSCEIDRSSRNTSQARSAAGHQIVRSQLDLEPTAASADVDVGQLGHGGIDVGLQPAPLPERADTANDISRRALRFLR